MYSSTTSRHIPKWIIAALTLVLLLSVWEICVDAGGISPKVLAAPSAVFRALVTYRSTLFTAASYTLVEGLCGFVLSVIAGLALGLCMHTWRTAQAALSPLISLLQMLPLITVAPLFVIWFGFEPLGKVIMVAVFSTFPIAVQTARGLNAVPRFYEEVALTSGAGRAWTLFHVKLRVAAGPLLGGMRIAATYVFATAATAEYLGAKSGLGISLLGAFNSFNTPLIFAATVLIIAMTGLLLLILSGIERLFSTSESTTASGEIS